MARTVVLLLLALALLAVPLASADPGGARSVDREDSVVDPQRICQKVNGWNYCVYYLQGECDVWMTAYGIQWCLVDDMPYRP